jgi:hypothetical protein
MSSSPSNAAAALGLNPDHPKFWPLISFSAKLSAFPISSDVKLDNVEGLKYSDSYEL